MLTSNPSNDNQITLKYNLEDSQEDNCSDYTGMPTRRTTLFKRRLDDEEETLRLTTFLCTFKELRLVHTPIVWARLASGYRIVCFQADQTVEALELIKAYYFCTNQLCPALTLFIDADSIKKYHQFVLDVLSNHNSFCALEEGSSNLVGLALANVMLVSEDIVDTYDCSSRKDTVNALKVHNALLKAANLQERYQVKEYMCIHVVCVDPRYCNKGIATALFTACLLKARKLGIKLCVGFFPAGAPQTIGNRLGFKDLTELPWIEVGLKRQTNLQILQQSYVTCKGILLDYHDDRFKQS